MLHHCCIQCRCAQRCTVTLTRPYVILSQGFKFGTLSLTHHLASYRIGKIMWSFYTFLFKSWCKYLYLSKYMQFIPYYTILFFVCCCYFFSICLLIWYDHKLYSISSSYSYPAYCLLTLVYVCVWCILKSHSVVMILVSISCVYFHKLLRS